MLNGLAPLPPDLFFESFFSLYKKGGRKRRKNLPNLAPFLGDEAFAAVEVTWDERGLYLTAIVDQALAMSEFPNFRRGDSFELFLDTRKATQASVITRFCHHFVFLPEAVEGIQAIEVTRFRAEESRPLADQNLLIVRVQPKRSSYQLEVTLLKEALYGYDPETMPLMGLAYRINRPSKEAQRLALASRLLDVEKHPDLWASAFLVD